MIRKWLKIALGILLLLSVAYYVARVQEGDGLAVEATDLNTSRHDTIAIFGSTGTAGDGILKAVMEDDDTGRVKLFTRRYTDRIDEAVASGLAEATIHMDYMNYGPIHDQLKDVDAVFWALGTSARNVSKEQYTVIHIDFPVAFVKEWLEARPDGEKVFHLVSGEGAALDSRMHWAREKAKAEQVLSELADGTSLRIVVHRPSWIAPVEEQTGWLQDFGFSVLRPAGMAIRSDAIGQAMLELSARGGDLPNGTVLRNRDVQKYANAYQQRVKQAAAAD